MATDNPFLTNTAMTGLGMGVQPFNSQWYDQLSQSLWNQGNRNLTENVLPQINTGAQLAGQYGGSRQGQAQGLAMDRMNQSVFNALAPAYAQGYENSQNRGVQSGQAAMQGLLGLGGLDINRMNAQTNAAAVAAQAAGAPVYTSPWGAALGGGLGLAQIGNLLGWWGN
jgi:hypothetical protein